MGRPLTYIKLSVETLLREVALEEAAFQTNRIYSMLMRAGITLPRDRLDDLIAEYEKKIPKKEGL